DQIVDDGAFDERMNIDTVPGNAARIEHLDRRGQMGATSDEQRDRFVRMIGANAFDRVDEVSGFLDGTLVARLDDREGATVVRSGAAATDRRGKTDASEQRVFAIAE